ncbi:M16 family metallopeptidase, partial [Candidatus Omnitrophota bacterium]
MSHFIEHMVFKGTSKMAPEEIERLIKSYGGRIAGATSFDSMYYSITVLPEYLDQGMAILKEMMLDAVFRQADFQREKKVILNEMRLRRDDPHALSLMRLWDQAYLRHPYRYPIIGYENLFERLNREDLLGYYNKVFVPNNIIVTVVGDIEIEAVESSVRDLFEDFRISDYRPVVVPEEPGQIGRRFHEERIQTNLSYLAIGFHSTSLLSDDLFAMDCLAIILGRGDASRLNRDLVKNRNIAFSAGSFNYTPKDPGLFIITSILDEDNMDPAARDIFRHIDALKREPVSEDELKRAKRLVLGDYAFSRQSIQSIAADLAQSEYLTGNPDFSKRYVEGVQAVTADEITAAARKYLVRENSTEIRVVPKREGRRA